MWIPINTNGKVEWSKIVTLTYHLLVVRFLQHETLQPQMVSALNVLANSHHRIMMNNNYHYMHIWLVEAVGLICFAESQFFPTARNRFYLITKLVENIEKVNPLSIPIKSNH